ncbi:MAG: hypothetical protein ACRBDL_03675 [Alphaproteobacteria bacterium]
MLRLFILLVLLFVPQTPAFAQYSFCGSDNFQLDFISDDMHPSNQSHFAEVHGTVDVPNPGYMYSLVFKPMDNEGTLYGILTLGVRDQDKGQIQVVSKVGVRQGVDIPFGTTKVIIEVVKPFGWGANYYQGNVNGLQSVCLAPVQGEIEEDY